MAIFGAKDADVDLPTQFYQLEFDTQKLAGSELDRWASGVLGRASGEEQPTNSLDDLASLAHLHRLFVSVMNAMADNTPPAPEDEDVERLNARLAELRPVLIWDSPTGTIMEFIRENGQRMTFGRAPEKTIKQGWNHAGMHDLRIKGALEPAMLIDLAQALEHPDRFRRCATCGSVFIAGREDQRRCSRRCNDREYARRALKTRQEGKDVSAHHVPK